MGGACLEEVQWQDGEVCGKHCVRLLQTQFLFDDHLIGHGERLGLVQQERMFP